MAEKKFIDGLHISKFEFDNGDEIIKLGINFEKFADYAMLNKNDRGYLNIDLKKSKKGEWYAELNTFQKNTQSSSQEPQKQYEMDELIDDSERPF